MRDLAIICGDRVYNTTEQDYRGLLPGRLLPGGGWVYETDQAVLGALKEIVLDADYTDEYQRLAFGRRGSAAAALGSVSGGSSPLPGSGGAPRRPASAGP